MALFSVADIVAVIFLLVAGVDAVMRHDERRSSKALTMTMIVSVVMVLLDSFSGYVYPASTPDAVLYVAEVVTAIATKSIMLCYYFYCYEYFRERTAISKWLFVVPMALLVLLMIGQAGVVLSGNYVTVSNGTATVIGKIPSIINLLCIVLALYLPALAIIKRKAIGISAVLCVGAFNIFLIVLPLMGLHDFTTCCGGCITFITYVLLQNGIYNRREREQRAFEESKAELESLNAQLEENQAQLEEAASEQEAQIEEITALNSELEERQAQLEEAQAEQEAQIEEISSLNAELVASRNSITEAYGMIEGFSQDYHTIWVVSKETSEMRLVRSNGKSTIRNAVEMGLNMPRFDEGFDKYIETYVEPEDRERMHREIAFAEVLRRLEEEPDKTYAVNYLRRTDDGKVGYHQIAFANADTKDGHRRFVYGFRDVDAIVKEEQAKRRKLEERMSIISALSSNFENVYLVQRSTRSLEVIKLNGYVPRGLEAGVASEKRYPYDAAVEAYIEPRVFEEDKPAVRDFFEWDSVIAALQKYGERSLSYRVVQDGAIHHYQGKLSNVEDPDYFVAGFQCIDDAIEREQQQNLILEKAKEAAEAASAAKTSFLFNMSHDIRTPMNAIMGFRDLLEKHQDDPVKRQDYLNKIQDSSTVLLSIINNVLEMARIEKGTLEIDETAWSTEQFNDTLYSVFHVMMEEKGLRFTRQIEVQHHFVYCDPTKLREIFINILSNAYKYTNAGGSVNMHLEEIPSDREGWVLYRTTISDTGIGMNEEFLPHIFEEFAREQNTTDAKVEGTGLGMPIVKRLVEMLNGTIEVTSKKGEGSKFVVTLPHKIAERADLGHHAPVRIDPRLFKNKRLLLTEDNDLNAEIAMEILEEAGFILERAEDGEAAVRMLNAAERGYYDAILMDIQMPHMNGYEATRAIRQLEDSVKANIKIIAMTANAFEEDKREAMRAGMNGHIAKPIDVTELMKTLANVFRQ